MTTERAMRLAQNWSNGLVCSLREGEAAEYHKMFLDMLRVKQEAEQQGPCSRCGYGGQHLDAPPCTTCEVENSTPLTLDELREMDSEPVFLAADNRWYIVNINYLTPCGARVPCGIDKWGQGTSLSLLAECGIYRRKPEEGAEIGVAKDKDVPTNRIKGW